MFRISGFGFGVAVVLVEHLQSSWFRVSGFGVRVRGSGFGVWDLGFGVAVALVEHLEAWVARGLRVGTAKVLQTEKHGLALEVEDHHERVRVAAEVALIGFVDFATLGPQFDGVDERAHAPVHHGEGMEQLGVEARQQVVDTQVALERALQPVGHLELDNGHSRCRDRFHTLHAPASQHLGELDQEELEVLLVARLLLPLALPLTPVPAPRILRLVRVEQVRGHVKTEINI